LPLWSFCFSVDFKPEFQTMTMLPNPYQARAVNRQKEFPPEKF
jgi:hypothetical protein